MRLLPPTLCAIAALPCAAADALSDFASLQSTIQNASVSMLASIMTVNTTSVGPGLPNGTFLSLQIGNPFPTAATLANLTIAISSSQADCDANQTAFINGTARDVTDAAYLDYIDTVSDLAQAITNRGVALHFEWNMPVWNGIQALAAAIHSYGTDMASRNITTYDSTIRTITVGSALFDAQGVWSMSGTASGMTTKKVRKLRL